MIPAEIAPIGSIVAFAGPVTKIPQNWQVCDGSRLNKNTFATLFDRIGTTWGGDGADSFFLPDLRGQFLRGVDKDRSGVATQVPVDPDRDDRTSQNPEQPNPGAHGNNVGSHERDALQSHRHDITCDFKATGTNGSHDADGGDEKWNSDPPSAHFSATVLDVTGARTSGETRPRNAFVYWIMKVQ